MRSDVGKLTKDWNTVESLVLYGAGNVFRRCEKMFQNVGVKVEYIIDGDPKKQGLQWNCVPIVSYDQVKENIKGKKIVIMAAHTAFNEISKMLERDGLKEFQDFCRIGQFICEWFWNVKGLNCVYKVDMTITTCCTLKCKHCNMFIPYHDKHFHYSFEELKRNIDLFFERVDFVADFGLIGGEPLLSPVLSDIIIYLNENYSEQFGIITFASNGTIIPTDEVLNTLRKYQVFAIISDYSRAIAYEEIIAKLKSKFDEFDIMYEIRPSIEWCDFGFPENPVRRTEEELEYHLQACRPEWNGLNDGKFYYCNLSWSAEKCGRFQLQKGDYIELEKLDPGDRKACHALAELSRGTSSFCRVCGGCGKDNELVVPTGIQMQSEGEITVYL